MTTSRRPLIQFIFDLDGVLLNTLPFLNIVCACMINDALQRMTNRPGEQFTTFDEIYNSSEIIGSIYPEKLEWVIRERGLSGLNSEHPVARESYLDVKDIIDELIEQSADKVRQRPQGESIIAELQNHGLLEECHGEICLTPFARVAECLQSLQDSGAIMGVASTNYQARTESLLEISGLRKYFHSVTGTSLPGAPSELELNPKGPGVPDVYLAQYAKMIGADDWRSLQDQDLSHVTCIEDSPKGGAAVISANMTLVGICHDGDKFTHEEQALIKTGARIVAPDFATLTGFLLHNKMR